MPPRPRESEPANAEQICKRYDKLLAQRANVDTLQQELADYVIPRKAVISERRSPGEELTEKVYDSTPIRANELLAATMQGSLMSPAVRWFSLKLRNEDVNLVADVAAWLEEVESRIYLSLRQSNFNAEAGEVCLDLGAFGIGAVLVEEHPKDIPGFNGLLFKALAPGTYVIAEAAEGRVDTLIRCTRMTTRQVAQQFGEAALTDDLRSGLVNEPDHEHEVLHAVMPRRVTNPKRRDRLHKPWASAYVLRQPKHLLQEGGFEEFPYLVPRWAKTSGEVYGRGPGHTALPSIRTLNRIKERTFAAVDKAIDPPGLTSSDSTFAQLDLTPGAQNTVDGDPARAWVPLESGTKFDVAQLSVQDERKLILEIFYWDQLQLQSERLMTATEVERRLELMRRVLGPTLGRFESEFLAPLLARCFGLMWRAGALPGPPPEIAGQDLDVEYEGPLARSQKAIRLAGAEQTLALLMPISQHQAGLSEVKNVLDNFDFDAWARDLSEVAGLPPSYRRSQEEVEAMREERQEALAQQRQMQQVSQVAEAAGKGAPALRELQALGGAGRPAA